VTLFGIAGLYSAAWSSSIIVPDNYPTISAACTAANPGDAIYLRDGNYSESVVITKMLSLQSLNQDPANTWIYGSVTIYGASYVNIYNLSIGCTQANGSCITVNPNCVNTTISTCYLYDKTTSGNAYAGVIAYGPSNGLTVQYSQCWNLKYGIQVNDGECITLTNNYISGYLYPVWISYLEQQSHSGWPAASRFTGNQFYTQVGGVYKYQTPAVYIFESYTGGGTTYWMGGNGFAGANYDIYVTASSTTNVILAGNTFSWCKFNSWYKNSNVWYWDALPGSSNNPYGVNNSFSNCPAGTYHGND
jgi:hypothetical protein